MRKIIITLLIPVTLCILYACAGNNSISRKHSIELHSPPNCTECHIEQWKSLNHQSPDFYKKHGRYAGSNQAACNSCHNRSFCADCHTRKDELKPSQKRSTSPELNFPHRPDYMTQHKIDGRINPASCTKCHGRQNNTRCLACHR